MPPTTNSFGASPVLLWASVSFRVKQKARSTPKTTMDSAGSVIYIMLWVGLVPCMFREKRTGTEVY